MGCLDARNKPPPCPHLCLRAGLPRHAQEESTCSTHVAGCCLRPHLVRFTNSKVQQTTTEHLAGEHAEQSHIETTHASKQRRRPSTIPRSTTCHTLGAGKTLNLQIKKQHNQTEESYHEPHASRDSEALVTAMQSQALALNQCPSCVPGMWQTMRWAHPEQHP